MKKFLKRQIGRAGQPVANNDGWAIMSAMIAIFIGLIMMAGIFGLVQIAMTGSNVQKAQDNIGTMRSSIQQLFAGQPDYTGLTTDLARRAGVFPGTMIDGSNNVRNAWSGQVNVSTGNPSTRFEIAYNGVPEEECIRLAPFGYGTWASVSVGGSSISQSGGGAVADAVNACSGNSNMITFESE